MASHLTNYIVFDYLGDIIPPLAQITWTQDSSQGQRVRKESEERSRVSEISIKYLYEGGTRVCNFHT
jgi:hypothetical protein